MIDFVWEQNQHKIFSTFSSQTSEDLNLFYSLVMLLNHLKNKNGRKIKKIIRLWFVSKAFSSSLFLVKKFLLCKCVRWRTNWGKIAHVRSRHNHYKNLYILQFMNSFQQTLLWFIRLNFLWIEIFPKHPDKGSGKKKRIESGKSFFYALD